MKISGLLLLYKFMFNEAWAGRDINPKLVIVLGGQGGGKSWVAEQFVKHKYRLVLLDKFFEPITRKRQQTAGNPEKKIRVSIKNPQQKKDYVQSAMYADRNLSYFMDKGFAVVTEKTGQNYGTVASLKQQAEYNGYDVYCIWVDVDVEIAVKANAARPDRSLDDEQELRDTHKKVRGNMFPSQFGGGFKGLFGDKFFQVTNDRTPESNAQIQEVINQIVTAPLSDNARNHWQFAAQETRGYMKSAKAMSFKEHFAYYCETAMDNFSEPGVVKVMDNPQEEGSMLVYNINSTLEPGKKMILMVPESYRHLIVRDMVLAHRKGPHGHGEPNMKWEAEKNKWRDYYGAYTRIEAHDTQSGTWHTYVDDYGMPFKFAEHRPGDFEEETLHDWIRIAKVKPDAIRLTNPGNQRVKNNPITGEKVDPMDKRSTSEIASLKIIFFPDIDLDAKMEVYERFYSKTGGPDDAPSAFAKYDSQNPSEKEPSYGNYGAGIYPNALVLVANWSRQGKRIREVDGKHWFIVAKDDFDQIAGEVGSRARASGGNYNYHGRDYVKVFPVTTNGGPGTQVNGSTLSIEVPSQLEGKKLAQIEVMCGDTEFRPDGPAAGKPWKRLGYARLKIGIQSKSLGTMWLNGEGVSVAPAMVAAAAPKQAVQMQLGDKILLKSEQDTTYVMGWRILYS